ncbi:ABC-type bacteriocin/lantibiotic exporter with double-glycine peptidase domain [Paenibacillus sp. SORGH_AS306]|uniref:peptidase domain-containing ABC transporter n=1 Tax=unclassified Paenibacillus TaxID=185978 RepID=UPI00278A847E|nr:MULTISPECIES: peptidase domain-containing ABC transporter [unclassified Paenibacillus]MDQ1236187.1 ABC-type bacteriocin/lantibiotic exporter with double-glycine peptidase domain [Paenibacillus sp. SORGH_AS_0306]MDR6108542.1 ABC-type bacteriocin/lantibiotic exporter with double-glycine peptidase domain [Paenibacillus sp. SORGH_AS_0338]
MDYLNKEYVHARKIPFVEQMQQSECGLCCLAMILGYYRHEVGLPELRKKADEGRNGTSLLTLKNIATAYNLQAKGQHIPTELLHLLQLPAIIFWNQKHYVVLEAINDTSAVIIDPEIGRSKISIDQFNTSYSGIALSLVPNDSFQIKEHNIKQKYSYFLSFFKEKKLIYTILFWSLILQCLTLSVPILLKYFIDTTTNGYSVNLIHVLGASSLVIVFIYLGFTLLHGRLLIHLQNRLDTSLMDRFISHLFKLPYKFFELRSSGDLILRTNSNIAIRQIISNQLISTIINFFLILILTIYMFTQSISLTTVVLSVAAIQVIIIMMTRSKMRSLTQAEISAQTHTSGYLTEAIQGVSVVKSLGIEKETYQGWRSIFDLQIATTKKKLNYQNNINSIHSSFAFVAPLLVAWFGSILLIQNKITLGTLFAFQSLVVIFLAPFNSLAISFSEVIKIQTLLERIRDILDTDTEANEHIQNMPNLKGNIQLKNIHFHYHSKQPILKNINLYIQAGQKVAIIGKTGSGKSTLASLIAGLYEPTQGDILFDGYSIKDLNTSLLRKKLGIVMQEDFLFNRTIKENLQIYNNEISLEQIIRACQIAEIHEDILRMPMGYETIISEMGSNLSGGQKQRLVLARALVIESSVLILDEATSALDTITEQKISQNLDDLLCTRVIIAHRLSTILSADTIILIDNGEIQAQGSHRELINSCEEYKAFYQEKANELQVFNTSNNRKYN